MVWMASGHIAERTNLRYFLAVGMCASGVFTALFGLGRYWHIHSLSFYIGVQVQLPSRRFFAFSCIGITAVYSHIECSVHVSRSAVLEPEKRRRYEDQNDNDGGATTSAIHCWPPSIHHARPNGVELVAGRPPCTAGL